MEFASNGKHGEIQKVQFDESLFVGGEEIAIVKIKMQCICAAFFCFAFCKHSKTLTFQALLSGVATKLRYCERRCAVTSLQR